MSESIWDQNEKVMTELDRQLKAGELPELTGYEVSRKGASGRMLKLHKDGKIIVAADIVANDVFTKSTKDILRELVELAKAIQAYYAQKKTG